VAHVTGKECVGPRAWEAVGRGLVPMAHATGKEYVGPRAWEGRGGGWFRWLTPPAEDVSARGPGRQWGKAGSGGSRHRQRMYRPKGLGGARRALVRVAHATGRGCIGPRAWEAVGQGWFRWLTPPTEDVPAQGFELPPQPATRNPQPAANNQQPTQSETALRPAIEPIRVARKKSRQKSVGSRNSTIPMITVPTAPMPVQTA